MVRVIRVMRLRLHFPFSRILSRRTVGNEGGNGDKNENTHGYTESWEMKPESWMADEFVVLIER